VASRNSEHFLPGLGNQEFDQEFGTFNVFGRAGDPDSGHVHDGAHTAFLLIGHDRGDRSGGLRGKVPIDIVVVHNACRDLPLRDGVHNLRTLLVYLRARIGLESLQKLLRPFVSEGGFDY